MFNRLGIATLMLLLVCGCDSPPPGTFAVSGDVTWEGQPLPDGDIILTPLDGGMPSAAKISAGTFRLYATPGKLSVSIIATREVGEIDPTMGARRRESYIPARYNDETTLVVEVTEEGKNQFRFELTGD